jgi:LysM repeat protein/coenzyme F420-reducing hydrogenase delta subunit
MKVSKSFFKFFVGSFFFFAAASLFADTTHMVEKGETLYSISRKYQITVSELRAANGLSESDVLKFGQKLSIPSPDIENAATLNSASLSSGSSYSSENLETYVAQKGDTYYGIARERGIKVAELFALNNLGSEASLKAGQKLKVPAKASSEAQTVALDLKDADPRKYSATKSSSGLVWPVKNPRITYVNGKVSGVQLSAAKKEKIMNDFEEMLNQLKKGLGEMADDVREKYGELSEYLDKHNTDEIAADLKEAFNKTVDQTKEKVADVREDVEQQVEKMKADYKEAKESGKIDEQINEVKENLRDGADKAKEMVDKSLGVIEEQLKDLRSRLGL